MIYIDLMCVGAEFTRSTGRRICDYCPVPNQHIPCIEHNSDLLQYIYQSTWHGEYVEDRRWKTVMRNKVSLKSFCRFLRMHAFTLDKTKFVAYRAFFQSLQCTIFLDIH